MNNYTSIIKKFILNEIKQNQVVPASEQCFHFLNELGYELSTQEKAELEKWIDHILNLRFIHENAVTHNFDDLEEIIVHSPEWLQFFGKERYEFFGPSLNTEDYQFSLEVFCLRNKILWNESHPFQSFQVTLWGETWRATLLHSHLSAAGPSKLFLRAQKKKQFDLSDFGMTEGQKDFLEMVTAKKKNVIVCGATGSGKTSFLRSLLSTIPKREHVTLLEDTHEIILDSPFVTKLLAGERPGETLNDYCQYALRLRPDRIILGEIRSREIVPFLLSINTGHGGMMASLHANSAIDAIHRMCLLFQIYGGEIGVKYNEVLKLVCQGVDYIVHLEGKKVTDILEIKGCEGTTPFYQQWN